MPPSTWNLENRYIFRFDLDLCFVIVVIVRAVHFFRKGAYPPCIALCLSLSRSLCGHPQPPPCHLVVLLRPPAPICSIVIIHFFQPFRAGAYLLYLAPGLSFLRRLSCSLCGNSLPFFVPPLLRHLLILLLPPSPAPYSNLGETGLSLLGGLPRPSVRCPELVLVESLFPFPGRFLGPQLAHFYSRPGASLFGGLLILGCPSDSLDSVPPSLSLGPFLWGFVLLGYGGVDLGFQTPQRSFFFRFILLQEGPSV